MTIHYHGTPITPIAAFMKMKGRSFCVSHAHPRDIKRAHDFGESVMLDNGAFSKWKSGKDVDWKKYYEWCDHWLNYPTTWAVIPDDIEGGAEVNILSQACHQTKYKQGRTASFLQGVYSL